MSINSPPSTEFSLVNRPDVSAPARSLPENWQRSACNFRKDPTTMRMQQQLTIGAIMSVTLTIAAHAQSRIDRLQPLVAVSAKRLAMAERVALAKWDRATAVEDARREAQLVRAAVASAKEKGLREQFISTFFRRSNRGQQAYPVFPLRQMAPARKSARAQADRFERYPSGTRSIARTANPSAGRYLARSRDCNMPS